MIATGSRPVRPPAIEFDEESILDSDGILNLGSIPQSLVVVGAGVIGIEYASMFAAVGTKVTVIDSRRELLPFCDSEIVRALQLSLRDLGVIFRLGETVEAVERHESGALIMLKSGKRIAGETVLYSAGRQGATAGLGLELVGVETDARGQIEVDAVLPHVGRGHLRRRRRDRLPGARRDGHGAGPHRRAVGARPADRGDGRATCRSASTRSRRSRSSARPRRS